MAESASATSEAPLPGGEAGFDALHDLARRDSNIVGFWLGGSRGKGRGTAHSDWDCALVVRDEAAADYRARLARSGSGEGLDVSVFSQSGFADYAAWGGPQAWDRYSFTHVRALVDRSGDIQALIDAKARVPEDQVAPFIAARLDHAINQTYRALKCRRDGDALAARLEAAEGVQPLLDAVFALHGGRLRPYPKYLARELATWPLERLPWPGEAFLALIAQVVEAGDPAAQQALWRGLEPLLRAEGHGAVMDAWGAAWPFVRG